MFTHHINFHNIKNLVQHIMDFSHHIMHTIQGRRRLLKSGPAMKHQIRLTSAEGTSLGDLPRENFIFPDVRRDDFNALCDNFCP